MIKTFLAVVMGVLVIGSAVAVKADNVSTSVTVGNSTPAVAAVNINSATAITLTENTTTDITVTATVTDANSCEDIDSVVVDLYRSGITAAGCDTLGEANSQNCYPRVACTVVGSGNTCDSTADTSADYTCTVSLQYYADPTSAGTYSAQTWEATVTADDTSATATDTDTEEVNTLLSLNVTASIDYGTIGAGSDTGSTNETTTVTNTGNVELDPELSGTAMSDGGSNTIAISSQEYNAATFTYGSGTDLSGSGVSLNLTLPQSSGAAVTDDVYWGLGIPAGTPAGSYSGTNTFTAAAGS